MEDHLPSDVHRWPLKMSMSLAKAGGWEET